MLVAAPRLSPHFLDRMLASAHLEIFDRAKSFDSVVEQIIQPTSEPFGLLLPEIADV
jgi:hypothetical protein